LKRKGMQSVVEGPRGNSYANRLAGCRGIEAKAQRWEPGDHKKR
jgi:hypothetical protein